MIDAEAKRAFVAYERGIVQPIASRALRATRITAAFVSALTIGLVFCATMNGLRPGGSDDDLAHDLICYGVSLASLCLARLWVQTVAAEREVFDMLRRMANVAEEELRNDAKIG